MRERRQQETFAEAIGQTCESPGAATHLTEKGGGRGGKSLRGKGVHRECQEKREEGTIKTDQLLDSFV